MRFHGAKMHDLRFHGVHTALTACWTCSDIQRNAVQFPCKRHGWARRLHNDPCAHPQSSYCVVGGLTAQLRWHCALTRTLRDSVCFEHAQSARGCSEWECCCDRCLPRMSTLWAYTSYSASQNLPACSLHIYWYSVCLPSPHPFNKIRIIFQLSSAYSTHQAEQNKHFSPFLE